MRQCAVRRRRIAEQRRQRTVDERMRATPPNQVTMPSVVVRELWRSAVGSGSRKLMRAVEALLSTCGVLSFDLEAARFAAELDVTLSRAGTPIGPADLQIAATVLAHGCTLVTHNTREFSRVPGLRLVDWYDATA